MCPLLRIGRDITPSLASSNPLEGSTMSASTVFDSVSGNNLNSVWATLTARRLHWVRELEDFLHLDLDEEELEEVALDF